MTVNQIEDKIFKHVIDVFSEKGLNYFGITKKVKTATKTEIIKLEAKDMRMDYTFLMEDDTYVHLEFQTTNKTGDLARFRVYEAFLQMETGKEVYTYVIFTGGIKSVNTELKCGINTYRINAIMMSDKNGDKILETLKQKIERGEELSDNDILDLSFVPVMGGELPIEDKLIGAVEVSKKINNPKKETIQSILYAFADKFLEGKNKEKFLEVFSVTELGKALQEKGMVEVVKKAIKKGMSNEDIKDLTDFSLEEIQKIRGEINTLSN